MSVIKESRSLQFSITPYRIHHIAINVTDLRQSIDFYSDILGLTVIESDENSAKLSIGDAELTLFKLPSDYKPCEEPDTKHAGSLNHLAFEISPMSFDIYHRRLVHRNIKITFGPVRRRYGHTLYFLDPDGNKIELFYSNSTHKAV
jgi:glyoxylase I family protein